MALSVVKEIFWPPAAPAADDPAPDVKANDIDVVQTDNKGSRPGNRLAKGKRL
jgi:hypothetical protein